MPQFDPSVFIPQLFWLAICFSILYLFISKVFLPRILDIINQRNSLIERNRQSLQEIELDLQKTQNKIKELREKSWKKYQLQIEESTKIAKEEREEKISLAKEKINQKISNSNKKIEDFIKNSAENRKEATYLITSKILEKVIGKSVPNKKLQFIKT